MQPQDPTTVSFPSLSNSPKSGSRNWELVWIFARNQPKPDPARWPDTLPVLEDSPHQVRVHVLSDLAYAPVVEPTDEAVGVVVAMTRGRRSIASGLDNNDVILGDETGRRDPELRSELGGGGGPASVRPAISARRR